MENLKIKFFPHQMSVIRWYQNTMKEINAYNNSLPKDHNPKDEKPKHLEIALMGGVGWGKTYLSHALALPMHGLRAKTKMIMCMENSTLVNATVRSDLQEKWPQVIKSNKEGLITLINGTEILLLQGYDAVKGTSQLDNHNISFGGMSQGENLPGATHAKLGSRCRNMSVDGETLIVVEGNPKGNDWIDENFCVGNIPVKKEATVQGMTYSWEEYRGKKIVLVNGEEKEFSTFAIYVPTQNFPWLPVGYLERQMEGKDQRWIDRYILGKRTSYQGLVYSCFSEEVHVARHFDVKKDLDRDRYCFVAGGDWGFRNPSAWLIGIYDRVDDSYYFYTEYYERGRTVHEVGNSIRPLTVPDFATLDPSAFARDPRGGDSIADILMKATGWDIIPADNSSDYREEVYRHLAEKRIVFSDRLKNTIREITHYTYGDDMDKIGKTDPREEPKKRNDHLMDSLKYIIAMKPMYKDRPDSMKVARK